MHVCVILHREMNKKDTAAPHPLLSLQSNKLLLSDV